MQISGVNNPLEAAKWGKTPLIQKKAAQEHKEQQDPTLEFFDRMLEQLKKSRHTVSTGLSAGWQAVALGIFAVPKRIRLLRYIRRMESKSRRTIQAAAVGRC